MTNSSVFGLRNVQDTLAGRIQKILDAVEGISLDGISFREPTMSSRLDLEGVSELREKLLRTFIDGWLSALPKLDGIILQPGPVRKDALNKQYIPYVTVYLTFRKAPL